MQTLEKIAPIPVRVDIAGERLSLLPIKTRELPKLFKATKPVLSDLQKLLAQFSASSKNAGKEIITRFLMDAPDQLAEALIQATTIAARKDRDWIDDLDLDELVTLMGKLIEVNVDFLSRRALPKFVEAVESVTDNIIGRTQSTDSSVQATE